MKRKLANLSLDEPAVRARNKAMYGANADDKIRCGGTTNRFKSNEIFGDMLMV